MALLDLVQMRRKCEQGQWSVDDIDWDAPGREAVTPAQAKRMQRFMADLVWIETFGKYAFEAMAAQTDDADLRVIYRSFAVDELRHADAERQLMIRWGMIGPDEHPQPNPSARVAIEFLERRAGDIPFPLYGAILPMFELALDGALIRFLSSRVEDPVCHQVFEKVNRDEARHLAVDFHTLEVLGRESGLAPLWSLVSSLARPPVLRMLAFGYVPLLERAWVELRRMGVPAGDLAACVGKFHDLGERNPTVARHPAYRLVASHAAAFSHSRSLYHWVASTLIWLTDVLDTLDSWTPGWAPVRVLPRAA